MENTTFKTEKIDNGWVFTTVKTFEILKVKTQFQSVAQWVSFHERNPTINNPMRKRCNRCRKRWDRILQHNQWVNLAVVKGQGNMVICDACASEVTVEKF
jgi:hypothetical protein